MTVPLWLTRLSDGLLTTDPVQRIRLSQAGLAMLLMAASVLVMHYFVAAGIAPATPVRWWTAFSIGGLAAAYSAIRSGWSLRFADPSLTIAQMVYAIACSAAAYALLDAARGAVFPILLVVLMFGMFRLAPRVVRYVSVYAVLVFGGVMAWKVIDEPRAYPPAVELGHFLMLATMLPAVSLLAGRLARIRERHREHRHDLAVALARIKELATKDELTGLVNRRHMLELLEQERQRCVRSGRSFCIALLDIDHFKRVNDQHGHAAGDEALRSFAREALASLRMSDVLARWGGEEFVLLLPDTRAPLARSGVERLRERLAALRVDVGSPTPVGMTFSAGVTEHIAGESMAQALERADRALYEAKSQGRNRVVMV